MQRKRSLGWSQMMQIKHFLTLLFSVILNFLFEGSFDLPPKIYYLVDLQYINHLIFYPKWTLLVMYAAHNLCLTHIPDGQYPNNAAQWRCKNTNILRLKKNVYVFFSFNEYQMLQSRLGGMRFNVGNVSDNDIKLILIVETETTFGCNENIPLQGIAPPPQCSLKASSQLIRLSLSLEYSLSSFYSSSAFLS